MTDVGPEMAPGLMKSLKSLVSYCLVAPSLLKMLESLDPLVLSMLFSSWSPDISGFLDSLDLLTSLGSLALGSLDSLDFILFFRSWSHEISGSFGFSAFCLNSLYILRIKAQ